MNYVSPKDLQAKRFFGIVYMFIVDFFFEDFEKRRHFCCYVGIVEKFFVVCAFHYAVVIIEKCPPNCILSFNNGQCAKILTDGFIAVFDINACLVNALFLRPKRSP